MKQSSRLSPRCLALGTALAAFLLAAQTADARPAVPMAQPAPSQRLKWDSKKFMHVSELRPGMKGYALSVFKGTKISRFGIEILGVVSKFNEGKDYIAFRVLDGPPVTRHLEIAHGMSGSPIYIGGRLVGAISLGNQFAKDPIGYATPIEYMFDAWSPDLPAHPSRLSASPPAPVSAGMAGMAGMARRSPSMARRSLARRATTSRARRPASRSRCSAARSSSRSFTIRIARS